MGEETEMQAMDEKLAEYFVYYAAESVDYVLMMEQLRLSHTRSDFLQAMERLIVCADIQAEQSGAVLEQTMIDSLLSFIRTADIVQVSEFRSSLSYYISVYELEKIHEQEQYLLELLDEQRW
jgi:hypothetical protein